MVNFSILISNLETSGPGGLFDIGATLPLVVLQFLLLMVVLNILLYSPLLKIITERNEFILNNLSKASETLTQASELTTQYEQELSRVRKEAQSEIAQSQKIHKEILDIELNISQKSIDNLLDNITKEFFIKKEKILANLDNEINTLSTQIENKLSI
jgi:F-type H+-transporting ATPase subunit b|tara:strand:+ start:252 stop:722 length:471 start_codon:yes stop_codon:yes gene_type:complete